MKVRFRKKGRDKARKNCHASLLNQFVKSEQSRDPAGILSEHVHCILSIHSPHKPISSSKEVTYKSFVTLIIQRCRVQSGVIEVYIILHNFVNSFDILSKEKYESSCKNAVCLPRRQSSLAFGREKTKTVYLDTLPINANYFFSVLYVHF